MKSTHQTKDNMINQKNEQKTTSPFPKIGFGTFQLGGKEETARAVTEALNAGYRLIDTAADYGNEDGVGEGVRVSQVPRSEVLVSTKVWPSDLGYDNTLRAFERSLLRLNLDYVDIYLIHWPCSSSLNIASWKALERLTSEKLIRYPGVSNFNLSYLEALLSEAVMPPSLNQIEFHPQFFDQALYEFCLKMGIVLEGWSPLMQGTALKHETLRSIAEKHHRSPAQIVLRWCVQMHVIPLPKTHKPARMIENIDIFDFQLDGKDMTTIKTLFTNRRLGPDPASHHFCSS
jgi:diketogulonate reductase-like aldo/keto reductase